MNESWSQQVDCNTHAVDDRACRARWETVKAGLFLAMALLAFFWPAVFSGRVLLPADLIFDFDPLWRPLAPEGFSGPSNPILSDQVYQFFPWKIFTLRALAQGQLPLWNPYTDAGLPFVGNAQSAIFGPFSVAGYLLPLYPSYVIGAILRLFVAGSFTFLFAREIGLGRYGALLAMVTFTFSGPLIVWLGHPHASVIVWLPAMLLTIERALSRRNMLYAIASGLTVAAQFLGGHPETSFHVMLAWGAYALYRAVALEGWQLSKLLPELRKVAVAAIIGVMLASVQLLPFVEALLNSTTPSMKAVQPSSSTSPFLAHVFFDWHDWPTAITALLPRYFGTDLDGSYWFPYSNCVEQNTYAGVLPLALAATVSLRSIRRRFFPQRSLVIFFALLAVSCLGVALRLPLLNVVNDLPVFSLAANGRLRLIYVLAIAILAGLGLDEVSRVHERCQSITLRVLVSFAVIALCLVTCAYAGFAIFRDEVIRSGRDFVEENWGTPYLSRSLEDYYGLVEERYEKKLALFLPTNIVMYLPVLIALSWLILRWWSQRRQIGAKAWAYAALGLTIFDAFLVGMPFNPTAAPQHIFPAPGAIQFLQRDHDIYRISGTGLMLYPNSGMIFGISDIRGYDTVVPRRYAELIDRLEGHYRFHFHSLFLQADSSLFDLLNVKYVLTDQELEGKWELVYEDTGSARVYRNQDVLPRAFVVHRAETVDSAAQSLERVTSGFLDFRETVVLEEAPPGWKEPPTVPAAPAVQFVDYQPNRVTIDVETDAAGLLVLTDTYAPGWKALLDGQSTRIFIANHAFRAVSVPSGAHQVEFVYDPLSFKTGAMISLLTAVALALVPVAAWIKRSRGLNR